MVTLLLMLERNKINKVSSRLSHMLREERDQSIIKLRIKEEKQNVGACALICKDQAFTYDLAGQKQSSALGKYYKVPRKFSKK